MNVQNREKKGKNEWLRYRIFNVFKKDLNFDDEKFKVYYEESAIWKSALELDYTQTVIIWCIIVQDDKFNIEFAVVFYISFEINKLELLNELIFSNKFVINEMNYKLQTYSYLNETIDMKDKKWKLLQMKP